MTLPWQLAFLLIGSDPVRFRPMMIPSIAEKFVFGLSMVVLFLQARVTLTDLLVVAPDFILGVLFILAFAKTSAAHPAASDARTAR